MTEKDILKLVKETFDEEISTSCSETLLGLTSWIEGQEEFMENLTMKLKLLFDEKDTTCKTDAKRSFSVEETKVLYSKAYKTAWDVMAGSENMKGMTSQKLGKDLDDDINNFWCRDTGLE